MFYMYVAPKDLAVFLTVHVSRLGMSVTMQGGSGRQLVTGP